MLWTEAYAKEKTWCCGRKLPSPSYQGPTCQDVSDEYHPKTNFLRELLWGNLGACGKTHGPYP